MTKLTTVGSKKAVEPEKLNNEILLSTKRQGNFDQVAVGVCPHDESSLSAPVSTKGTGEKVTCSSCGHTWYLNKKIRTCKCLTCSGAKRNSAENGGITRKSVETRARDSSMPENSGGPLWVRTTDLSLIRTAL